MIPISSMLQLLCVDPIVEDATVLAQTFEMVCDMQQNEQHAYSESDKADFQRDLEINCWQIWIQKGPGENHYCIQYIECLNPKKLMNAFADQKYHQNRFAAWLYHQFQTFLPSEYSLRKSDLKINHVLHLSIDSHPDQKTVDFCYMLPLLPNQLEAHQAYCHEAMNEKREQTITACKAFGMAEIKKWIQESDDKNYVIYYQKMTQPIDQIREAFLSLKNHPNALKATQSLRDQTGLTFEELMPKVTCLTLFPADKSP